MLLLYTLLTLLTCFHIQSIEAAADVSCSQQNNCTSCVTTYWWWVRCRWCPLTKTCHHPLSAANDCSSSELEIDHPDQCPNQWVKEEHQYYAFNTTTAELMAKWSSMAYVPPWETDIPSIGEVLGEEIRSEYEFVEMVTSDCDLLMAYGPCSALVAYSATEKHIILAFSGTGSPVQLVEELIFGFTGMVDFEATRGQILRYNQRVHSSLHSCVEDIVKDLLARPSIDNSSIDVMLTGHSLGGAQAQLAAARLISEGVVKSSNVQVYAFASPRVGDIEFAVNYDKLVQRSWRVVSEGDPVPQLVPKRFALQPYAFHTKGEILYRDEILVTSNYTECKENEDINCSANTAMCFLFECLQSHGDYFVPSIEDYMADKVLSIPSSNSTGSRMHCKSYMIT